MGANPRSYILHSLAVVFPPDARDATVALQFDGEDGAVRVRIALEDARALSCRLRTELDAYDVRRWSQSPISEGMCRRDGSPDEGQSV
jgi:hypothetical protein